MDFMRENYLMVRDMAGGPTTILNSIFIKVNEKRIKCLGRVRWTIRMEANMWVNGNTISGMGMVR